MLLCHGVVTDDRIFPATNRRTGEEYSQRVLYVAAEHEADPRRVKIPNRYRGEVPTVGEPITCEVEPSPYVLEDGRRGVTLTLRRVVVLADLLPSAVSGGLRSIAS